MRNHLAFELKSAATVDETKGEVHAVISVYTNRDGDGDQVMPGAFSKAISRGKERSKLPPGVLQHDLRRVVAKTLDAYETGEEMHVLGAFNLETQDGRETFSNIKGGFIQAYSYGFRGPTRERKGDRCLIHDVGQWLEWSPVTIPANDLTYTAGTKGLHDGLPLSAQFDLALDTVDGLLARVKSVGELRKADGRALPDDYDYRLRYIVETLNGLACYFADPVDPIDLDALRTQLLRHQAAARDLLPLG
jgi:HK97 family phage prohead protease